VTESIEWSNLFAYCEDSESKLINKINRPPRGKINEPAGYKRKDGYWLIGHNYRNVLLHRVIFEMFNGEIGYGIQIDHIDGNPSNNSISNLRSVSPEVNQRNMKMNVRNTSGKTGVSYLSITGKKGNINKYWSTSWKEDGVQKSKRFPISELGYEEAYTEACIYRDYIIDKLNKEGYEYASKHGK
jgi:hypothetical protein